MTRLLALLPALLLALPARASSPQDDRLSDHLFEHPYGEPGTSTGRDAPAPVEGLGESSWTEEKFDEPRPLKHLAIAGMGGGAGLAGFGGSLVLTSLAFEEGSDARGIFRKTGIGLAIAGAGVLLAGATLLGIDALAAPSPTPDAKGAQLVLSLRF